MAPKYALEIVDFTLRTIMNNELPFGGKIIILGGDFRQLLPVQRNSTKDEVIRLCIKHSSLWKHFRIHRLTQNMRSLESEKEFARFLLKIGNGSLNDHENNVRLNNFPSDCIANANDDIVKDIYEDIIKNKEYRKAVKSVILSPRNEDVNAINEKVIDLLDVNTEKIFHSIDSVENCDNGLLSESLLPEYLNTLNPPSLPPHKLRLRQYSVVILLRNLNIEEGLVNGTRLLVTDMNNNVLRCEILTGDKAGEIVFLSRITLYSESDFPFKFKRRQFPVKLAFAMTINKAQGQTFEKIGLELSKNVFTHGQLYVALSRIKSWAGLKIYISDIDHAIDSIKNYVYQEIL